MNYRCSCKDAGPLVPVRIGIEEDGKLIGTVCFKQWCPNCGNSRLNNKGEIMYYTVVGGGNFNFDPMNFWVPENVSYQAKQKFIDTVLKFAYEGRFLGEQCFTMEQVREAFRGNNGSKIIR